MTVPPVEPEPDIPGSEPEVPNPDIPADPDDVEDLVPDGDRAAQAESAWPEDEDDGIVPDPERVVHDLDED